MTYYVFSEDQAKQAVLNVGVPVRNYHDWMD